MSVGGLFRHIHLVSTLCQSPCPTAPSFPDIRPHACLCLGAGLYPGTRLGPGGELSPGGGLCADCGL